ncbi:hypothetical protein B0T09DRAFT_298305 [Sordaria sp. MPI-SDFR-AT-0083]|nr:hypothetical protein B0T09DRAFT_298305 [Sordaria sp. MPI-SDFR-AT-0083]
MLLFNIFLGGVLAMLQVNELCTNIFSILLYPQIVSASALPGTSLAAALAGRNATASSQAERRSTSIVDVATVDCELQTGLGDTSHHFAQVKYISEGIQYLKEPAHSGHPKLGPALNGNVPCDRVSCSWDSAIFWCNEDPENSKELPGYDTIAEATHKIMKECEIYNELGSYILGHVHLKDQWSVVVKYDKC